MHGVTLRTRSELFAIDFFGAGGLGSTSSAASPSSISSIFAASAAAERLFLLRGLGQRIGVGLSMLKRNIWPTTRHTLLSVPTQHTEPTHL